MALEGGFQGRTNKLVDGCYSFWVGGVFPLLDELLGGGGESLNLQHAEALSDYVLGSCQHPTGGLIDKPGKYVSGRARPPPFFFLLKLNP